MKHTPGPWMAECVGSGGAHDNPTDVYAIVAGREGYKLVAEFTTDDDAHLIAAAPDLLEALRALYQETADYIRLNHLGDEHHNRSMQMARDALAKVEGK